MDYPREQASEDGCSNGQAREDGIESTGRRFYNCIYCRQGFTNAQALGGHMNIHRKDKAKAKQPSESGSVSSVSNKHSAPLISRNDMLPNYYAAFEIGRGYGSHLPPSSSGGRAPEEETSKRFRLTYGEPAGASLSLWNAPATVDDCGGKKKNAEAKEGEELDLELRLGYNP